MLKKQTSAVPARGSIWGMVTTGSIAAAYHAAFPSSAFRLPCMMRSAVESTLRQGMSGAANQTYGTQSSPRQR